MPYFLNGHGVIWTSNTVYDQASALLLTLVCSIQYLPKEVCAGRKKITCSFPGWGVHPFYRTQICTHSLWHLVDTLPPREPRCPGIASSLGSLSTLQTVLPQGCQLTSVVSISNTYREGSLWIHSPPGHSRANLPLKGRGTRILNPEWFVGRGCIFGLG